MTSIAVQSSGSAHLSGSLPIRHIGRVLLGVGLLTLTMALFNRPVGHGFAAFFLCFVPLTVGAVMVGIEPYLGTVAGIKNDGIYSNDGHNGVQSRGVWAYLLGALLTTFYCLVYWWPTHLSGLVALTEPFAQWISGGGSSQWFLYGFLYTVAVCVMGARMAMRYRHNRYQLIRTASVMFFQFAFGFTLPQVLKAFSQPEYYFTYFWPLKYDYLFPGSIDSLMSSGALGVFMVFWGLGAAFVATPILTYFYGKRWYCSWVCGCGGLAETAGDPFRQLSNKSRAAWRFERWSIHLVLVLITVTTIAVWVDARTSGAVFGAASKHLKEAYGFYVGAVLSGVIGVGFYPLLGTRVWCRFFCPMAAVLGLLQRFFSGFRITTNGAQCISCGNCSTYCEMGIDVRAYAQRGENIVRASCVGCGVCAAVCPRGVLKLENGSTHADRFAGSDHPLEALMRSLRQP